MNKICKLLIFLFFMLKPFYLWKSGLPQIADMIFFIFILLSPWGNLKSQIVKQKKLIYFMAYTTAINLFYIIKYPNNFEEFLYSAVFIIFLGLGYLKIDEGIKRDRGIIPTIYWGTVSTIVLQFLILIFRRVKISDGREALFFNNPNQLGYFILLGTAIFAILNIKNRYYIKNKFISILIPVLSLILIVKSQSRAAIGGELFLLVIYFIKIKLLSRKNVMRIGIFISILFILNHVGNINPKYNLVNIIQSRIENASTKKDNGIAGRGYDRIYIYPEYLFMGSGEGGFFRYDDPRIFHKTEIHSLYGTILFSYGFIGLFFFCSLFHKVFLFRNIQYLVYFIPIFIYNLTHNGIRSQLFWILICVINHNIQKGERRYVSRNKCSNVSVQR